MNIIKKEITNCLVDAMKKEQNLLQFLIISQNMELITHKIGLDQLEGNIQLNKDYVKLIDTNYTFIKKLENSGRTIKDFQNEFTFKLLYQIFEELLFDLFVVLFQNFPKFLNNEKIELNFNLLFEQDEIKVIRKRLIEKRAKKYIQSNNIKTIINKFKRIFGVKILISKKEMDEVLFASKVRNILTHNNGIINDFFINELKYENIKSKYELGDSITGHLQEELKIVENIISKIGSSIVTQINTKMKQIESYYSTLE